MRVRSLVAAASAAVLASALQAGVPTSAADRTTPDHHVRTIVRHLVGPLNVARNQDGTIYFTENFANNLYRIRPGGEPEVIFRSAIRGATVESVDVDRGRVRFVVTGHEGEVGLLKGFGPRGRAYPIADVYAFEKKRNPDRRYTYGFRGISKKCAKQVPPEMGPATYKGVVDSHAYGLEVRGRTTYIADAGGNDILKVGPRGKISVVAVLPPVPVKVTRQMAEGAGLPKCTIGKHYRFEAVPTDVEVGPGGWLYVSSLPGGPEDGSAGAHGSVVKVNPRNGKVVTVAKGLVSATGVGVGPRGDVFVSQMFAGMISRIRAGGHRAVPYVEVPLPADVDVTPDGLLAAINVLPSEDGPPDGKIVMIER